MKFNMIMVVRYKYQLHSPKKKKKRDEQQLCFFIEELNGNMQLFSKALKLIKPRKKKYSPMNIV